MQEFVESLAAFEIVEQRLHRHARPDEDRRASENFRIAVYEFAEPVHVATLSSSPSIHAHDRAYDFGIQRQPSSAADAVVAIGFTTVTHETDATEFIEVRPFGPGGGDGIRGSGHQRMRKGR